MRALPLTVLTVVLAVLSSCRSTPTGAADAAVAFRPWSQQVFATARAEGRLVLLDLGTSWCHWCHVMERTTYADPAVCSVLAKHYVAVAADADRRLDLAARYQDYGWPATVVFDADGRELWKARGYVEPQRMHAVLARLVNDARPIVETEASPEATTTHLDVGLAPANRSALVQRFDALLDAQHGGYLGPHKYLDLAAVEWLLSAARDGDTAAMTSLLQWLDAERALIDPVWGGAYQYSHGGVWTNPHFEKVMSRQLADLRGYSLAFGAHGREQDLASARQIALFLTTMLATPEGPFRANQDADLVRGQHAADYFALPDRERRALGMPRIEPALWSRENGQALQGLASLAAVDRDPALLVALRRAADWLLAHRCRPDGLFAHGDDDQGGPFLADSLEMACGLLALGEVSAEPRWCELAVTTARAMTHTFAAAPGGYASAVSDGVLPSIADRAENIAIARLCWRLHHLTGDAQLLDAAQRAFAYVAQPTLALQPGLTAELLLADSELASAPVHIVIVGAADDATAQALFATALRYAPPPRLVEWITADAAGATNRRGETFPVGAAAAAFVCGDGTCSPPIEQPEVLRREWR